MDQGIELLACVTFKFRRNRMRYLFESLRALRGLATRRLDVAILTDTDEPADLEALDRIGRKLSDDTHRFRSVACPHVKPQPRTLPWEHVGVFRRAIDSGDSFTYALYIEEDIQIDADALGYFCRARPLLAQHGLIPGFVRFEFNDRHMDLFVTDQHGQQLIGTKIAVQDGGWSFVNLDSPYTAMFLVDRPLLDEYLNSPSSELEGSLSRIGWGDPERAAMGLTWENVPAGFSSRLAIPLVTATLTPHPCCWVYHSPNNYTNDESDGPNAVFGKTRMDAMFSDAPIAP